MIESPSFAANLRAKDLISATIQRQANHSANSQHPDRCEKHFHSPCDNRALATDAQAFQSWNHYPPRNLAASEELFLIARRIIEMSKAIEPYNSSEVSAW